jgi:hypothetical protein
MVNAYNIHFCQLFTSRSSKFTEPVHLGQTKGISTQRERERERDERVFSVMVEHCGVGKEDKN